MTMKRQIAETFHPGVFLEEELEARGWSRKDLAEILGRSANDISLIITGKRGITPETAIGLGDAFDTGAEYWMNLETACQLSLVDNKRQDIALKGKLYAKFPVREMSRRGWVETSGNVNSLVQNFCAFFDITSLDAPVEFKHAARKSGEYTAATMIQAAWLFRARQLARKAMLSNKFTPSKLKTAKAKLRLLLHEAEEIRKIPDILAEAGIRFVIVEYLPKGKMDGATFWLDDDSPVIALSLLHDRIDNFWFTLMHEISHVENGEGKDEPILDLDLSSQDETIERPRNEVRADRDSSEYCIPQDRLNDFVIRTDPYYHEHKIQGFALVNQVHAGVVVGQLQKRRKVRWDQHRKLLVKIRHIITESSITDGYGFNP